MDFKKITLESLQMDIDNLHDMRELDKSTLTKLNSMIEIIDKEIKIAKNINNATNRKVLIEYEKIKKQILKDIDIINLDYEVIKETFQNIINLFDGITIKNTEFERNERSRISQENERVKSENIRINAESTRAQEFNKIKSDNEALKNDLITKVNDKTLEYETSNNNFKESVNLQINDIKSDNENFKAEVNKEFAEARTGYDGTEYANINERLKYDFDRIEQRNNNSTLLEHTGTNIKADKSYFGLSKDLSIKGRTLQNLFKARIGDVRIQEQQEGTTVSCDYINGFSKCIFGETQVNPATTIDFFTCYELKPSTTYYMNSYVKDYDALDAFLVRDSVNQINLSCVVHANKNIITFTTTDKPTNRLTFYYFAHSRKFGKVNYGKPFYMPVQFLVSESLEFINTPFFENIKSVGEVENNLISVKSCGKNLFRYEDVRPRSSLSVVEYGGNSVTITDEYYCGSIIKIKRNTRYYVSATRTLLLGEDGGQISIFKSDGKLVQGITPIKALGVRDGWFDSEDNEYISFLMYGGAGSLGTCKFSNVQVEEIKNTETTGTNYFAPIWDNQNAQLDEPLRGLSNTICDEIIRDDLIRRVGKVILTDKMHYTITNENEYCVNFIYNIHLKNSPNLILSDKLPSIDDLWGAVSINANIEGVDIAGNPNSKQISICLSRSKCNDVLSFKEYIKNNPITIYYELGEPISTKLPKKAELKTFDEVTHFTSNNLLVPNLSVKVPSNVQAFIMKLKNENETLENEVNKYALENNQTLISHAEYDIDNDLRITMLELGI